jgi:hypothetical protein
LVSIFDAEENFLKQKARNKWLNLGDGNNAYFHKSVKARNSYNLIKVLKDAEGNRVIDMKGITDLAVGFYQHLLSSSVHEFSTLKANRVSNLFQRNFFPSRVSRMQAVVSRDEVPTVIFSMNKNKALGPDGFFAEFFQAAWPVVGEAVCDVVLEFFHTGKMLREVNAAI